MCLYEEHRCICVPNMKFLCLILWLGEVCTDTNADDANCGQRKKHDCKRPFGDKANEPKTHARLKNVNHQIILGPALLNF